MIKEILATQEAKREFSRDCTQCYFKVKDATGSDFHKVMHDLIAEVIRFQYDCPEGTTFIEAAIILCFADDKKDNSKDAVIPFIKAMIAFKCSTFDDFIREL